MKSLFHIAAVAPVLLSTAFLTAGVAQAQPARETPGEVFQRYFFNKSNREQLRPTLSADYFLTKPHQLNATQANQTIDTIIANEGRFANPTILPAYRIYSEDCARGLKKTSQPEAALREKFYTCLYDTTQLSKIKLQATARTVEQANAAGLSTENFAKLPACQAKYRIVPGVREGAGMEPAIGTMLCVNNF